MKIKGFDRWPSFKRAIVDKKNKNHREVILILRSRADSNRCRSFCRALPKPLGHRTLFFEAHKNRVFYLKF